jgi:hypothetical protein
MRGEFRVCATIQQQSVLLPVRARHLSQTEPAADLVNVQAVLTAEMSLSVGCNAALIIVYLLHSGATSRPALLAALTWHSVGS